MSANTFDAIVIGGGIVGAAAAYTLARGGARALLADRRDAGRATDAGAGILSAETSGTTIAEPYLPLALRAVGYYPPLVAQLAEDDAGETGYAVCGELIVAADEDELDAYEQKKAVILQRQRQRGLPSADDLREVSEAEARALFPPLGRALRALYFRGGARVDGRLLAEALLRGAARRGMRLEQASADSLIIAGGRVTGAQIGGMRFSAPRVIIAGGAWSSAFGAQLGVRIPVEPQRGQIAHLWLPGAADTRGWPIIEAFHGHYLVAWPDGRIVAGATRETDSGFAPQTTAAGVHEVLAEALRVAPGLRAARIGDLRVGLRPRTADHLPVLGAVPGVEGVYLATGHGANGLQLGPYTGKLAADWALGRPAEFDVTPYSIERFDA